MQMQTVQNANAVINRMMRICYVYIGVCFVID